LIILKPQIATPRSSLAGDLAAVLVPSHALSKRNAHASDEIAGRLFPKRLR
jgi:hypothetical protein